MHATRRNCTRRILRESTLTLILSSSSMRGTLLLHQVAKLPIFRADRRFVGGVSNSNYVANGAPTERRRSTFAKVSHPGLLFWFPGFATATSKLLTGPDSFCAANRVSRENPPAPSLIFKLPIYGDPSVDSRSPAEETFSNERNDFLGNGNSNL